MNGLSRELIIHPGETLKEVLEDREMSQRELAYRIGLTEPYISNIINCVKPITISLAKKLEYALGIESAFWINLQANYEKELSDYEEVNSITVEEISVIRKIKDLICYMKEIGLLGNENNESMLVIELRRILKVSNLNNIPNLCNNGAYRLAQVETLDPYVLFTWLRICDLIVEKYKDLKSNLDIKKLEEILPEIKNLMFEEFETIKEKLRDLFSNCGINFAIVKNFKGAPVQGVINRRSDNTLSLIMTNRRKYADIFWFTLFHEIGHILNNDFEKNLIDYDNLENEVEEKANIFSANMLIDKNNYDKFILESDFSITKINDFCNINNIPKFILIGRLQKEGHIPYNQYGQEKIKYD